MPKHAIRIQSARCHGRRPPVAGWGASARNAPSWLFLLGLLVALLCLAPAVSLSQTESAAPDPGPPASLEDLSAWTDYKARLHAWSLPVEARIFFRRGLLAREAGNLDEAVRLVRGAIDLDPSLVEGHWALARWMLFREPGQAVAQIAALIEALRHDFTAQWTLAANGAYLLVQGWYLALIAFGLGVLLFRQGELRHAWRERLALWAGPRTAGAWAWVLLLVPFLVGFGVVLPLVAFLALLWPASRPRERAVFILMIASFAAFPLIARQMDRLVVPMRDERPWLGSLLAAESDYYSGERHERFARLAAENPDEPLAHFGAGWLAAQAGDHAAAEEAYRGVLRSWPSDSRALNNLGNVIALQDRFAEAVPLYRKAAEADPRDATALFNLSQALTHEYEFAGAADALARASAIDFDRVRSYREEAEAAGVLLFVPEWLAPRTLWRAVLATPPPGGPPDLPPAWRGFLETWGWTFSGLVVAIAALFTGLGVWMQRRLPLLRCSNCGAVVCRRCTQRRRAEALCASCATVAAGAPSADFARVLLLREAKRRRRLPDLVRWIAAVAVPGLAMIGHRRVVRPLLLFVVAAVAAGTTLGGPLPYVVRPQIQLAGAGVPLALVLLFLPMCALSVLGHLDQVRRAKARGIARLNRARRPTVRLREPAQPREDGREAA